MNDKLVLCCTELEERIIDIKIASTLIDAFQRELPGKAKAYNLTNTIAEGRCFQAILADPQQKQKWTSTPLNNIDQVEQLWQLW